ncbi:MAG TPA: acetyl CoA synthetase subunit alpha [Bacteroidetes bacterium]|nr:acetyl CoA synthetase subunit alpha [Bacteroidota bacterium]HRR08244.1 bifunctional acetate--CoA ligase family protein/GNAT family N-acetyltransferase [Rhodothermales bacterium]
MKLYPSHDILRENRRNLNAFFNPKSVAVVGATDREGSVGRIIMENLQNEVFKGKVFPVNPSRTTLMGLPCHPSLAALPQTPELTVIVTPATTVPALVQECAEKGCRSIIIISAGFKEIGEAGIALEKEVLDIAKKYKIRIIGPNCLGVMRPKTGLNATFADGMAKAGSVALISQSGAMCTAILDWSRRENVGFSAFVSIGSMLDVSWGDLLHQLGNDPQTKSIVLYMESIGDARSFMSAAREVSRSKPIIVIKAGSTEEAAKAAASHTGSMAGSFDVLRTAFRRVGVMRVERISELFNMADILSKQPRPKGNRLAIITNAGGPGVLATDALINNGGTLSKLAPETIEALNTFLPSYWSHANPIDVLGDATPEIFAKTLDVVSKDPNTDGLLVVLTPQAMTDPTESAKVLVQYAKLPQKPVLAAWMGGEKVAEGHEILNSAGIPVFEYPDTAAQHFVMMYRYFRRLESLYQTPRFAIDSEEMLQEKAVVREMISKARAENREILTESEAKQILAAYGIPTVPTYVATTEEEAVSHANRLGYPVVVKIHSHTITHKTDVGGVKLNLRDANSVRRSFQNIQSAVPPDAFNGVAVQPMVRLDGYELILGASEDSQFGPVLLFGAGGTMVEVFKDRALGLPPLNTVQAKQMIEQTKISLALKGIRGKPPVNIEELQELMVRFSQLVTEQRRIKEIDINPLLATADGFVALDARVVLHPASLPDTALPQPAIRPYPTQYVSAQTLKTGQAVIVRPIMAEDEPLIAVFHEHLSERSVYMRYFQSLNLSQRTHHDRLIRVAHVDYGREMALVMEHEQADGTPQVLAIGRLSVVGDTGDAEFSMLIRDDFQRSGIGTKLLSELVAIARAEGMQRVIAEILPENRGMQRVCEKVGFTLHYDADAQVVHAVIEVGN